MIGLSTSATQASLIIESPTAVATLSVTQAATPNPSVSLILGGATLTDGFEGRYGGSYSDSAMKFDLGGVGPGGQIASATFSFTVSRALAVLNQPSLNLSGFSSDGPTMSIADFSTPMTSLGTTGSMANQATNLTFTFDVSGLVASIAGASGPGVGFILSVPTDSTVLVYGDDASNPSAFRPTLSITYNASVPEPSSLALTGIAAAIGLASAAIRRKTLRAGVGP